MENLLESNLISAFEVYRRLHSRNKMKNKRKAPDSSPVAVSTRSKKTKVAETVPAVSQTTLNNKTSIQTTNKNGKEEEEEEPPKLVPINKEEEEPPINLQQNDIVSGEKVEIHQNEFNNTDPTTESQHLFQWLISPIKLETFFNNYWEKQVLHIKRNKPAYYSNILDSTRLDRMLRENPLYYTRNVDVVAYENGVKESFNQDGRAVPSALWDFYANGCSIRILNPQTYSNKIHIILATLQEYFGTMVGANVYLTPPNSQGFAPHFDDIEAFVVQLEGRKHWKLYHPKKSDVLTRESSGNFKPDELDEPFKKLTLEAGDVLYFPRGIIHEGHTDSDAHSLHITISVYQHTAYIDLLEKILPNALKAASANDVEFRKGLPLNYLKHLGAVNVDKTTPERSSIINNVKKLMRLLVNYIDVDSGADELGRKFMYDSMPPVVTRNESERTCKNDGDRLENGKVVNRVEIGLDTKIRLLRYHCMRLVLDTPTKIYYNTENSNVYHGEEEQWLELEPRMISVIKMLQNQFPNFIDVESLPIDDVTEKLQLVSDLWEHGLLITERPLDVVDDDDSD